MRIALAQINTRVGDVARNVELITDGLERAATLDVRLVVFPELCVPGYPPTDALGHDSLVAENIEGVKAIAARAGELGVAALVGFVDVNREMFGKPLYNALAQIDGGEVVDIFYKTLLPSYDVFDEHRYFKPNDIARCGQIDQCCFAPMICEDLWHDLDVNGQFQYQRNPMDALMLHQPEIAIAASASPFSDTKHARRLALARRLVRRYDVPLVYVNLVGMNEGLLYDGRSFVMSPEGDLVVEARAFDEDLLVWDSRRSRPEPRRASGRSPSDRGADAEDSVALTPPDPDQWRAAIVRGIRDFFNKTGLPPRAVLGLSGGIDSAVVAALAVEALGAEGVVAATMPSPYSSEGSVSHSVDLARRLGIRLHELSIAPAFAAFRETLAPVFAGMAEDVTEENLQARARGTLLMAMANKLGGTVLGTGNKSELAVGYCTMYGDLIGGLAPIGDLYKTEVYALARHLNERAESPPIPEPILTKPPSAELRPDQRDQDELPPYELLDPILRLLLERGHSARDISEELTQPLALVERVLGLVGRSEYKRRQGPPPLRLHDRGFGIGWRYPIMGRFPG